MEAGENKKLVLGFVVFIAKIAGMTGILLLLGFFVGCNQKNPQLGYELYLSGLKSYSEKDFSAAEKICLEALQQDKSLFQAELLRIKSLFFLNEMEKSQVLLEKLSSKALITLKTGIKQDLYITKACKMQILNTTIPNL